MGTGPWPCCVYDLPRRLRDQWPASPGAGRPVSVPSGLTDSWQLEPPHVPFNFEFDPVLRLDAILTLPDATRDLSVTRAIQLEPARP